MRLISYVGASVLACLLSGATLWACAPDSKISGSGAQGGSGGAGGSGGVLFGGGGSGATGGGDADVPDNNCGYSTTKANTHPVTLYLLVDKSASMAGFKWDAAVKGLTAFVSDPASAGLTVGLRFFPRPPDAVELCDQKAYQVPEVPFGLLPGNATALENALKAGMPDGFSTPVYTALGGGILAGIDIGTTDSNRRTAVILVTDGKPEGQPQTCGMVNTQDVNAITNLATTGYNFKPSVRTYVIGLPGVDQAFANAVAAAGGTDSAILVSTVNVEQAFKDALTKVRGDALPCDYAIPEQVVGGQFEVTEVNVVVTPSGKDPAFLPQVKTCGNEAGWKYDDPANPKQIILCPASCSKLNTDFGAKIEIALGCETIIK